MASNIGLLITFILSFIIILIVISINIYLLVSTNNKVKKINDDISDQDAKFKKLTTNISAQEVEFKKLATNISAQEVEFKKLKDDTYIQQTKVNEYDTKISTMNDNVDVVLSKINKGIEYKIDSTAFSILDLKEFKDLDPYLKDAYKRYIVNILSSALMKGVNKTMSDIDLKKYLSDNQTQLDNMAYSIAKQLQTEGLAALDKMY